MYGNIRSRKIVFITIATILVIVLMLKFLPSFLTGLASQTTSLSIDIQNTTLARFTYFYYPSEVVAGNSASFIANLQNVGNNNITAGIGIIIKNSQLATVSSSYDENRTLAPLDMRNFTATYTPTSAGTYWVIISVTYNSSSETKTLEENRSFNVTSAPVSPTPSSPTYPGGAAPPLKSVFDISVEYPKKINLTQNESYIISIIGTNNGNADIHKLYLSVTLDKIKWEINPKNLSVLPPKTSVVFLVSLDVPSDAETGNYSLNFTLHSDEISKKGETKITVLTYPKEKFCPEIESAIKSYSFLLDGISVEIEKAAFQGRNVTSTLMYFREARKEFDLVKDFFNLKDCEASKQHLELVRKNLELAITELARSIIPGSPLIFYMILIVLASIASSVIIIIITRKKLVVIFRPMTSVILEDRNKIIKRMKDLGNEFNTRKLGRFEYNLRKEKLEKELEKIDTEIIMRFGSDRFMKVFEDVKKAYIEGVINKKIYNKTREKLVNKAIREKKR